jgi:hypothetical protein
MTEQSNRKEIARCRWFPPRKGRLWLGEIQGWLQNSSDMIILLMYVSFLLSITTANLLLPGKPMLGKFAWK